MRSGSAVFPFVRNFVGVRRTAGGSRLAARNSRLAKLMRFVQDIPHPQFRIGLYAWNSKYIVKIEAGPYEQTYKVAELDVSTQEDVLKMLDGAFLGQVAQRFGAMDADWQATGERNDIF